MDLLVFVIFFEYHMKWYCVNTIQYIFQNLKFNLIHVIYLNVTGQHSQNLVYLHRQKLKGVLKL